jgi:hypothetical protein
MSRHEVNVRVGKIQSRSEGAAPRLWSLQKADDRNVILQNT